VFFTQPIKKSKKQLPMFLFKSRYTIHWLCYHGNGTITMTLHRMLQWQWYKNNHGMAR